MSIERADITGLILTGGRENGMGAVDRGLRPYLGMPVALHVVLRLAPHVGELMISANRNLAAYESMGVPVWPDLSPDKESLLTGWLTGLEHCTTRYMVTVPCDAPRFPDDLVARLADGLAGANGEIAMAATCEADVTRLLPVFCLMSSTLLESLTEFVREGQSEITVWTHRHRCVEILFDDAGAFMDANFKGEHV